MTTGSQIGRMLKQRRVLIPLTLQQLAAKSGVSASHLARTERGERFPSARILRKIAEPLGFSETELFTLAHYLPQPSAVETETHIGQLDPYVQWVLSQEPVETQRAVIGILSILKSMAKGSQCNIEFAEYAHRKYAEVDEDVITMVKDILEHPPKG